MQRRKLVLGEEENKKKVMENSENVCQEDFKNRAKYCEKAKSKRKVKKINYKRLNERSAKRKYKRKKEIVKTK